MQALAVRLMSGKLFTLNVQPDTSVCSIIAQLEKFIGPQPPIYTGQLLHTDGTRLGDSMSVAEVKLAAVAEVNAVMIFVSLKDAKQQLEKFMAVNVNDGSMRIHCSQGGVHGGRGFDYKKVLIIKRFHT